MKPATSELVAVAWVKQVAGIAANGMVSTTLPADNTTWAASGFVRVGPSVGGSSEMYVPITSIVMQFDTFAVNQNSLNPAWDKAAELAQRLWAATYDGTGLGVELVTRAGYRNAVVQAAWPASDPRRIYDDPAAYGHFSVDLHLRWREIDE
jgi:hypothetical protein